MCKNFETQCFCFPDQTHFTTWSCFSWRWLRLPNSALWPCARHAKPLLATSSPIGLRHGAAELTKQQKETILFRRVSKTPRTEASQGCFVLAAQVAADLSPENRPFLTNCSDSYVSSSYLKLNWSPSYASQMWIKSKMCKEQIPNCFLYSEPQTICVSNGTRLLLHNSMWTCAVSKYGHDKVLNLEGVYGYFLACLTTNCHIVGVSGMDDITN